MADIDADYCVVGAGFAGLSAAYRLHQAGQSVALLEARDRFGGRTYTEVLDDGTWLDKGAGWVGPGQDRLFALMDEFGVQSLEQDTSGKAIMDVGGKQYRYEGTIPLNLNPWAVANMGAAFLKLQEMAKEVNLEAPWESKHAAEWDAMTLENWLDRSIASKPARELFDTAISGCYTSAPSEVSMLFVAFQMASGGGPQFVLGVKGGAQDARPIGGMGAISSPMAAALGESLHLSQPVRRINQDQDGVTVQADGVSVRARRAIVAVPIAIVGQIEFQPYLPVDRSLLHQRMPSGAVFKIALTYDEPFWRQDGLTGQSVKPGAPALVTIDASPPSGRGVLVVITEGPIARQLCHLDEGQRRKAVVDSVAGRFGERVHTLDGYHEQNWTVERWSGGGMLSHAPTGVLTEFGHALRAPCGRIHWAGTESSPVMCGWVDGAVRSGERAAAEVQSTDGLPVS
jgi:monoamine oxidase